MCEHGDTVRVDILTSPPNRHSTPYWKPVGVDRCLGGLIQALNDGGVETVAHCCGHNKRPGNIILRDGREFLISPDFDTARVMDRLAGRWWVRWLVVLQAWKRRKHDQRNAKWRRTL